MHDTAMKNDSRMLPMGVFFVISCVLVRLFALPYRMHITHSHIHTDTLSAHNTIFPHKSLPNKLTQRTHIIG